MRTTMTTNKLPTPAIPAYSTYHNEFPKIAKQDKNNVAASASLCSRLCITGITTMVLYGNDTNEGGDIENIAAKEDGSPNSEENR